MISVKMDDTDEQSLPYIDALVAFWPGLQALMGDLKPAIVYHQILHHIVRRNSFLPEAFRENMQVESISLFKTLFVLRFWIGIWICDQPVETFCIVLQPAIFPFLVILNWITQEEGHVKLSTDRRPTWDVPGSGWLDK